MDPVNLGFSWEKNQIFIIIVYSQASYHHEKVLSLKFVLYVVNMARLISYSLALISSFIML